MMISKLPRVVPTCTRTGLVYGLSWTGLAAPTTIWLRAKVSNLMAICDARQWSMTGQTVKSWDRNRYAVCEWEVCKDLKLVKAEDFFTYELNNPGNTSNQIGSKVTTVNVEQIPGLNTLGVSLVRIDYAPYGQNPPHTHSRGTGILVVVEGTLYVGFVMSNQDGNRLFTKFLNKGDVFVFPIGLIHFQFNPGHYPEVAFAGLGSQNPGVIPIAMSIFGSSPAINPEILAKAFQLDQKVVEQLQKKFWVDPN
ncbi:hypothetical protein TIFTF001_001092 [Ficus carica]|uniref:Germin-like protein n=1 Tax=Ficus carica TaxID=3494 RepID=A0AA87Z5M6_FICCA|nr:hypothetical protein TIFTF001_001092 [Ficus carica]